MNNRLAQFSFKKTAIIIGVLVASVIVVYPFLPAVQYSLGSETEHETLGTFDSTAVILSTNNYVLLGTAQEQRAGHENVISGLDAFEGWSLGAAISNLGGGASNLIIPKIGVNMPIAVTDNEATGLDRGAWLMPDTSTPDKGGNTAFAGHRFRYVPPSSKTFYLLDKLTIGDEVEVNWQGKTYLYEVKETKIVPPSAVEVLDTTARPTITLITCDPVFSTANRLIVRAELVRVH